MSSPSNDNIICGAVCEGHVWVDCWEIKSGPRTGTGSGPRTGHPKRRQTWETPRAILDRLSRLTATASLPVAPLSLSSAHVRHSYRIHEWNHSH